MVGIEGMVIGAIAPRHYFPYHPIYVQRVTVQIMFKNRFSIFYLSSTIKQALVVYLPLCSKMDIFGSIRITTSQQHKGNSPGVQSWVGKVARVSQVAFRFPKCKFKVFIRVFVKV